MKTTKKNLELAELALRELFLDNSVKIIASKTIFDAKNTKGGHCEIKGLTLTLKKGKQVESIKLDYWNEYFCKFSELSDVDFKSIIVETLGEGEAVLFSKYHFAYCDDIHYRNENYLLENELDYDECCNYCDDFYNEHRWVTCAYSFSVDYPSDDDMFWDNVFYEYKSWAKDEIAEKAEELGLVVGNYKLKHWFIGYKAGEYDGGRDYVYCLREIDSEFKDKEAKMLEFIKQTAKAVFDNAMDGVLAFKHLTSEAEAE